MKLKKWHGVVIVLVIVAILVGCFIREQVKRTLLLHNLHLYEFYYAVIHKDASETGVKRYDDIRRMFEKYPNVIGINNPASLGQPVPLLIVLPSPKNKFVGTLYADGSIWIAKLGSKDFFVWQDTMLANSAIHFMTRETLEESLWQTRETTIRNSNGDGEASCE